MKTLYIVRHAKSSWNESNLSDFERPLNKRGKRDAPFMGKLIIEKGILPEKIISSPANRAISTANYFADAFNFKKSEIVLAEEIYEAGIGNLMKLINRLDDGISCVMIFGHNPGLTMLTQYLAKANISNIPTCGVVKLILTITNWKEAEDQCGTLGFFEYPRKYFKK